MSVTDAEFEAAIRDSAERAREQMVKRNNSIKNGDIAGEARADSALHSILSTTSNSIPISPSTSDNEKRQAAKQELERASEVFRTPTTPNNRAAKDNVLTNLHTFLRAKHLAALLGVAAVGLLATPTVFLMANGTTCNGDIINNPDGTTIDLFDQNGNGLLDHQETINTATGAVITPDQPMSLSDTVQDLWDLVSNFF